MITIGIDNGITGGLCAISDSGLILKKRTMPIQQTKRGNEVDVATIKLWLTSLDITWRELLICSEEPSGSQNAKTAASMAASFGSIRGACAWAAITFHRITPQSWQKAVLGKVPTGQTKPVALTKARELWPRESWLANPKCTKPHDGMIDAALIAEYARRTYKQ